MLAAHYGPVSDIEILWTTISFVGTVFGVYNTKDALKDKAALVSKGISNSRRLIADFAIRQEMGRTAIQILFTVVGTLAMFLPEAPTAHLNGVAAWLSIAARWTFIISSLVLLLTSIDSFVTRHQLLGAK